MKKNLTHLAGIVLLITILVAGACTDNDPPRDLKKVTIYLKAHEINGKMHLLMWNSYDTNSIVVDTLHTDVKDSTKVFWILPESSGLKKIIKIRPKDPEGKILHKKATGIWLFTKYKKHIVPDNQTPGDINKYYIKVKDMDGEKWEIDPYLRIPGKQ